MRTLRGALIVHFFAATMICRITEAQIPQTMSFQGILTDQNGDPVADGNYKFKFQVYDANSSGSLLWTETHAVVPVTDGLYTITLGSLDPLNIPFDKPYFLQIEVNDQVFTQRLALSATPYSLGILDAGKITSGTLSMNRLPVTLLDLATDGILSGSSVSGGIDATNITMGSIDNLRLDADLQDLADGSLSGTKLGLVAGSNILLTPVGSNIEISTGGSALSGSGNAGQLTFWNGTSSLFSDGGLIWDNVNKRLGIGLTNPTQKLDVSGTVSAFLFSGSGASLTSLSASNLTGASGSINSTLLDNDIADLADGTLNTTGTITTQSGLHVGGTSDPGADNLLVDGNITLGGSLTGNGSGLTLLPASNLAGANSLPVSVLPASVPIGNGLNDRITFWSGTGTVSSDADLTWNSTTNTLSGTNFSGNGSGLTSLAAANLTGTNTLPASVLPLTVPQGNGAVDRVTFWSGTGAVSSDADLSWNSTTNTLLATNFTGNGSGLTSLTASSLVGANTLPTGVLPLTVPLGNGATDRLTFWSGSGTVSSDADLTWNTSTNTLLATNYSGNGSGLTSINASAVTSGTLADSRLETNVDVAGNITTIGGLHVGGSSTPITDNLEVDGYSKFGTTAPAIQVKKLTGTLDSTPGNETIVVHGLGVSNVAKILSVDILVETTAGTTFMPPAFTTSSGFQYNYYVSGANIRITTTASSSGSVVGKPFKITLVYEQ